MKVRVHGRRRGFTDPEYVDAIHRALKVLIEVTNTATEGARMRQRAAKEAGATVHHEVWAQYLLMDEVHFRPRVLLVGDLEVPRTTAVAYLQFDEFLASIPSSAPPAKKASNASWAAPHRGSALIRSSKPATLPLRQ